MASTSCLVIGSPDFSDPPTKPVLLPNVLTPTTRIIEGVINATNGEFSPLEFHANLVSERNVLVALYVNYGTAGGDSGPFDKFVPGGTQGPENRDDCAGTLEEPCSVTIPWQGPSQNTNDRQCNTVTMVATPSFNAGAVIDRDCPADDQFSTLTWTILLCDPMNNPNGCTYEDCPGAKPDETLVYCGNSDAAAGAP